MRTLTLYAVSAVICAGQICGPSPELKTAIDESAKVPAAERLNAARALRDKYPDDLWVQRAYMNRVGNSAAVIDEYEKALENHPDDANYLFYRGSSIVGVHTADAIKYLDQALEKNPNLATAHAKLVPVYGSPNFKNAKKMRAHLEAFLKACPESDLSIYSYLERMDAPDLVRESAVNLRKALDAREDANDLTHYRTLWAIEFKAHPAPEYDQVREGVRHDLERLRKVGLAEHKQLAYTMREGYKLLGDKDGLKWVDEQVPPAPASNVSAVSEANQKFNKEHPFPNGTFSREAMDERNKLFLAATAEWIKQWPDEEFAWSQRYFALTQSIRGADPAFDEVAEAQLRLARKSSNGASLKFSVASMYLSHKMHMDQVEGLLKEGLAELDKRRVDPPSDMYPTSSSPNSRASIESYRANGLSTLCDYYLKVADWDQLESTLSQLRHTMDVQKYAGFAQSYLENTWKSSYSHYWQNMAALAEHQDHKLDALAYYKRAVDPEFRPDYQPQMMTDMVINKAKPLWTSLGGSAEAWAEWNKRSDAPKRETATPALTTSKEPDETNRALPPFTIKDLTGRQWTLANLKGKTTLVNLWATWCGPCREELPLLQKLYDRIKDRTDIAVVTLNTDDNPGLIDPFMKENNYSFPVLPARDYVDTIVPSLSIPRNWIINKEGILKSAAVGFSKAAGDSWIDKQLKSLEEGNQTVASVVAAGAFSGMAAPAGSINRGAPQEPSFLDRTLAGLDPGYAESGVIIRGEFGEMSESKPPAGSQGPETTAPRGPQVTIGSQLPEFALKDIAGKSWTSADLRGKVTLINVWATWCGPCRKELPMVQELHDHLKERGDIQIVTLNADSDTRLIKPFLDKNHFTFPVLPAREFSRSVVSRLTIPRTWVVDRDGIVRSSSVGYSSTEGKAWITRTLKSLEKLESASK